MYIVCTGQTTLLSNAEIHNYLPKPNWSVLEVFKSKSKQFCWIFMSSMFKLCPLCLLPVWASSPTLNMPWRAKENAAENNFDSYKELQIYGKVFIICSSFSLSDNLFFGIYPFQTIYHFSENKWLSVVHIFVNCVVKTQCR